MKLKVTLIVLITCISYLAASPVSVSLDGDWSFYLDTVKMEKSLYAKGLPDDAKKIRVPHTWNAEKQTADAVGCGWYEKTLEIPESYKGKNIRLRFEAVYRDADIYLNGKLAGRHYDLGYTRFFVDISKLVNYETTNKLIVCSSNQKSETALPYAFDWNNDGGIIRSVSLEVTEKPSIQLLKATPDFNLKDSTGNTAIKIHLWEKEVKQAMLQISIKEFASKKEIYNKIIGCNFNQGIFNYSVDMGKIKPWHFDNPNLYVLEVKIMDSKGNTTDECTKRFGFRKIEFEGSKLLFNGEAMRLPGIEYMAGSVPAYGMAEPMEVMEKAVDYMKQLNCLITRFHWQQDERILDLMDEKGILVQEEIPWWQSPGNLSPEQFQAARQHITDMIERDYNHPCIFSWGVSNEIYHNTDRKIFTDLIQHSRSLDNSRMVTVVSNEIFERLEKDESLLADIPTWNEYTGTWHGKSKYELPSRFDKIYKGALKKDDRPLLITEHGLCEPRFTGGDIKRIQEMTYHYEQWEQHDFVFGVIYFSLNDYRTHVGESGKGVYKARIHGLTDMNLNKKTSFGVYAMLASPIVIEGVNPSTTGNELEVILMVKNTLPSYILRNYSIRWQSKEGGIKEIKLEDMQPGVRTILNLKDVKLDPHKVEIIRPTGYVVATNII